MMNNKFIWLVLLLPLLFSCQKYNKAPFDEKEEKLRKYPDTLTHILIDSLWQKRDSLSYLRFKNVEQVYISETDSIPNWINKFDNLKVFFGSNNKNQIKIIPDNFYKLKNIERIYLPRNNISSIAINFYNLKNLQVVNLDYSKIFNLTENYKLKSLSISGNPKILLKSLTCS